MKTEVSYEVKCGKCGNSWTETTREPIVCCGACGAKSPQVRELPSPAFREYAEANGIDLEATTAAAAFR